MSQRTQKYQNCCSQANDFSHHGRHRKNPAGRPFGGNRNRLPRCYWSEQRPQEKRLLSLRSVATSAGLTRRFFLSVSILTERKEPSRTGLRNDRRQNIGFVNGILCFIAAISRDQLTVMLQNPSPVSAISLQATAS